MASIYIIKNTINKKAYIGQTIHDTNKRFRKHKAQRNCKNRCSALCDAFIKYGVENFYIEEIIEGDFTKNELNNFEVFFIEKYKTLSPNGYNLQIGGKSFMMQPNISKQISETMKGRKITWAPAISKTMTDKWADPVYREQMVKKHTGKRGYKYKPQIKPNRLKLDEVKIKELHAQGLTINKIAKIMGVCFTSIKRRI